ncbi:UbiA family prenyltransferase [Skermanella stibiiresistens]|uniref:UbiA family prenyltransferase n=1 Tax=Skermanella stibiiresistens TaxID=913326 RepID=UPI0004B5B069|nr:UbiA family prenyltransferase [Skermanella stibiiresistens]
MASTDALHRSNPPSAGRALDGQHAGATTSQAARDRQVPLCVDMDGTLLNTDSLIECVFALIKDWRAMFALFGWLLKGKAHLKQQLALHARLDPALLPYNTGLLTWLHEQKRLGRRLILATAADHVFADAVARHLKIFDEVIASDGLDNLRGKAKADAIHRHLGGQPYAYAGNDFSDLEIWRHAEAAVLVNAPKSVCKSAAAVTQIETRVDDRAPWTRTLLKALRPHQWIKNILVFVPIVTASALFDLSAWGDALLMFLAFCCTASAIYIINDLTDLAADRQHHRKRNRPFASGALPLHHGPIVAPVLLLVGGGLAALAGAFTVVVAYAVCSILYSFKLKSLALVDVFMLATLYTIRLFGGGEASGYPVSLWLLGFSSFVFLSLAIVKRVAELMALPPGNEGKPAGRGYRAEDLSIMRLMGVASTFTSCLVLALYVQSDLALGLNTLDVLYWAIVPLMLFWQCRIWLATTRGEMHDDPIVFAARDPISWVVCGTVFAIVAIAHLPV